jgi:hypothetical protein
VDEKAQYRPHGTRERQRRRHDAQCLSSMAFGWFNGVDGSGSLRQSWQNQSRFLPRSMLNDQYLISYDASVMYLAHGACAEQQWCSKLIDVGLMHRNRIRNDCRTFSSSREAGMADMLLSGALFNDDLSGSLTLDVCRWRSLSMHMVDCTGV